jgi:hypothetical protein
MSLNSAPLSKIPARRIPQTGIPCRAAEFPLRYGPGVDPSDQWTMTVMVDPPSGFLLGAAIYNANYSRGGFFREGKNWNLILYDYPRGQSECTPGVIRDATKKLSEILGPYHKITHSNHPPDIIDE